MEGALLRFFGLIALLSSFAVASPPPGLPYRVSGSVATPVGVLEGCAVWDESAGAYAFPFFDAGGRVLSQVDGSTGLLSFPSLAETGNGDWSSSPLSVVTYGAGAYHFSGSVADYGVLTEPDVTLRYFFAGMLAGFVFGVLNSVVSGFVPAVRQLARI